MAFEVSLSSDVVSEPVPRSHKAWMNQPRRTQLAPNSCIPKVLALAVDLVGFSFVIAEEWALGCVGTG